jgi:chromate transport protein ChrA
LLHELKLMLPPTIYFFCAFNLIVLNSNLLVHHYWFVLTQFLFATTMALIAGKVILVAHRFTFLDRYRGPPLYRAVLFKSVFYTVVVALVRVLEIFLHLVRDERGFDIAFRAVIDAFTWQHFAMVQLWLFTCFLIYVIAVELSRELGPGRLWKLFFGQGAKDLTRGS